MSAPLSQEDAVICLAKALYWKTEHLDPSDYDWDKSLDMNWGALDEHSRSFYLACIRWLLGHDREIKIAMGDGVGPHNDGVDRRSGL
jgi:hypothetical protein